MKIVIAAIQTPFIYGGAEQHIGNLQLALRTAGHLVEIVTMPFRFWPVDQVRRSMRIWADDDLEVLNGHQVDRVICLQFPAYYIRHPRKVLWLMHQFRSAYDLWDTEFASDFRNEQGAAALRQEIREEDNRHLSQIILRYANSPTVAGRLQRYNGLSATPLLHPPPLAEQFYSADPEPYVFAPGRIENAKRQDLLIRAMALLHIPLTAIISGDGGQRARLERLASQLGVDDRVKFTGRVTDKEKLGLYAHSLCVFFGARDEDYGYVTLEAMLAAKPVVTCHDSGEAATFVAHGETGIVLPPEPEQIALALERIASERGVAKQMGIAARNRYDQLAISWSTVVESLTATLPEGH